MKQVIVVFSSVTSAMGIKNYIYNKYGVQTKLIQTPKKLSFSGCSYCLVVPETELEKGKKAAKDNNVSIRGVFNEEGTRLNY